MALTDEKREILSLLRRRIAEFETTMLEIEASDLDAVDRDRELRRLRNRIAKTREQIWMAEEPTDGDHA